MSNRGQQLDVRGWLILTAIVTSVAVIHVLVHPAINYPIEGTPNNFELVLQNEPINYSLDDLPSDDAKTLLNISNFQYIINNNVCSTHAPLILAIAFSAPKNIELRNRIRNTWGQEVTLVFLLGETSSELQKEIESENAAHRDIVQGSFIDSYRNLTYKHIMAFKWAFYHCPGAKYLLKTDDDVFVNVLFLRKFIESKLSALGARKLVLCDIILTMAYRSFRSKWRVSPKEYSDRWFPETCRGWAILYSPDVSFQLYKAARETEYFWIDDIYVSGILAHKSNISLTSVFPLAIYDDQLKRILPKPHLEPQDDFLFCYPRELIEKTDCLWEIVKNTTRYLESST